MKMRFSEGRPRYDYNHLGNKLQESTREIQGLAQYPPYLQNTAALLKRQLCWLYQNSIEVQYMGKQIFSELCIAYDRPALDYASQISLPYLKKYRSDREGPIEYNEDGT